jgi:VanZ family protein
LWFNYFKPINSSKKLKISLLFLAIGFGILMETLQAIIGNNRSCDFFDVVANSVGAFSGMIFSVGILSNKKPI